MVKRKTVTCKSGKFSLDRSGRLRRSDLGDSCWFPVDDKTYDNIRADARGNLIAYSKDEILKYSEEANGMVEFKR